MFSPTNMLLSPIKLPIFSIGQLVSIPDEPTPREGTIRYRTLRKRQDINMGLWVRCWVYAVEFDANTFIEFDEEELKMME